MAYSQYSQYAQTGLNNDVKNRIDSNQLASNSEGVLYPNRLDIFVNKENTSLGGYAVVEEHTPAQLQGSKLYLDHRIMTDISGNFGEILTSNGVINTGQTDLFDSSIQFSTSPTTQSFDITYVAAGDQVQDSHINSMQNAIMAMQSHLGIKSPVTGQGTGVITLPIALDINPASLADYTSITNILPNATMMSALNADLILGGTQTVGVPGYGLTGITVYVGNPTADTRNNVVIDADTFTVRTTNGDPDGGTYTIGNATGDTVNISGCVFVRSQTSIGYTGGACGVVNEFVPGNMSAFYSNAMLRVHGGVWFGNGLSGNGNITFNTVTGESVTVNGPINATSLNVGQAAIFNGVSTFNSLLDIKSPGSLQTNSDMIMQDKPNGSPSTIDGLDPSYAKVTVENIGRDNIIQSVRKPANIADANANAQLMKTHPVLGLQMYPVLGGWTFTGAVSLESVDLGQFNHRNVLLLQTAFTGIGNNYPNGSDTDANLGGGSNPYGVYASGWLNPGDTYLEIDEANPADNYAYPVYSHEAFWNGSIVTGLNVYLGADDQALQTSVAGKTFRLFQPGNVPLQHLKPDGGSLFNNADSPVVKLGNTNNTDYTDSPVTVSTARAHLAGSNVSQYNSLFKTIEAGSDVSVNLLDTFKKSIEYNAAASTPYSPLATGIAYIYVAGEEKNGTREASLQLRASPSAFGPIGSQLQHGTPKIVPGQHVAVGEVVASTNDGINWTHVESVSYREQGFYDSCWVPMVEYRSAQSSSTSIPNDFGRCLPIYGSEEGTEYIASDDTERFQFFVEHNIGPVSSMADVDVKVWVAAYAQLTGHPILTGQGVSSRYKNSSAGASNLWSQYAMPYKSDHDFYIPHTQGSRGFCKEVTNNAMVKMFDSRFAQIGLSLTENQLQGEDNRYAQYIRVIVRKRN